MDVRPEDGFVEVQHFPWWAPAILIGAAALVLGLWATGAGSRPITTSFALLLAAFLVALVFLFLRMRTEVRGGSVEVSFGWLGVVRFRVPVAEIEACRPVRYHPLREFGGWGIRFAWGGRRAYSARGDRAAEIVTSRRTVLIGSERPEALCAAISGARRGENARR